MLPQAIPGIEKQGPAQYNWQCSQFPFWWYTLQLAFYMPAKVFAPSSDSLIGEFVIDESFSVELLERNDSANRICSITLCVRGCSPKRLAA
jgi:hypothetical protein